MGMLNGSCRAPLDQYVSRHISRHIGCVSVNMSTNTWPMCRQRRVSDSSLHCRRISMVDASERVYY